MNILKKIATYIKQSLTSSYIICLTSVINNKLNLIIQVEENLAKEKNVDLNVWAKNNLYNLINGKGGGQKHSISLVGENINAVAEVIKLIATII